MSDRSDELLKLVITLRNLLVEAIEAINSYLVAIEPRALQQTQDKAQSSETPLDSLPWAPQRNGGWLIPYYVLARVSDLPSEVKSKLGVRNGRVDFAGWHLQSWESRDGSLLVSGYRNNKS